MQVPRISNPDLSDDEHYRVLSTHEAGHMVTGTALGFSPGAFWMVQDRTAKMGGQTLFNGGGLGQHAMTYLKAGTVAEERALLDLGFEESTHPRLFEDCRGFNMREDNAGIDYIRMRSPRLVFDEERAARDAELLLASPRLWGATLELAADLRANLSLTPERVLEVLAPYRVEAAVREEGIKVCSEADLREMQRSRALRTEQAGTALLDRPSGRGLTDATGSAGRPLLRPAQSTPAAAQPRTPRRTAL